MLYHHIILCNNIGTLCICCSYFSRINDGVCVCVVGGEYFSVLLNCSYLQYLIRFGMSVKLAKPHFWPLSKLYRENIVKSRRAYINIQVIVSRFSGVIWTN